jgi:hypothetical protein
MQDRYKLLLAKIGNLVCWAFLLWLLGFSLLAVYFSFIGPEADPNSDRVNPAEVAWKLLFASHLLSTSFLALIIGRNIITSVRFIALALVPSFLVLLFAMGNSGSGQGLNMGLLVLPVLWYLPLGIAWSRGWLLAKIDAAS